MKRTLAKEALYTSAVYDAHHPTPPENSNEALSEIVQRLRATDPDGHTALSILQELEK
jgi:hypothetical protein